ncbi:MAG: L-seryl-tRNA(Sec) selenium transferase [Acidobacteria bacterium]|nr:MAG: L-seryl-tRNA(Sec) selenium transferase [Acidobacteriota bacterium]
MLKSKTDNSMLRALPSIDSLLKSEVARRLNVQIGAEKLASLARQVTAEIREKVKSKSFTATKGSTGNNGLRERLMKEAERRLVDLHLSQKATGLQRVINATGVVLHTNLGRAPLSQAAREAIDVASGYCTLEYDIASGGRGRRGARVEDLLVDLTGAEAALVVNNCAAAALLVLSTFARDGETIVSRGELVEIGGDFRMPDIMAQSGTRMIEVGTTNRTRLSDYRKAISDNTRLVMRVHTSNYRIVGFTKTPELTELAELAHANGLLLYEDAGSGALVDFKKFRIEGEPVIRESITAGADVVSFSGDKLLGGPQAGLIVGRKESIERMRSNPLYRALRADKLRLAALEATLEAYRRDERVLTQNLIAMSSDEIGKRAMKLINRFNKRSSRLELNTIDGESAVGGGSAPTSPLPTVLIAITDPARTPNEIEQDLRKWQTPIIVRILNDRVLIDLRTVAENEEAHLEKALESLSAR